ncbi:MAG: LuxR C-terminal-related transcriptional regulator [Elainellaceae cyanobacterium]
MELRQHALSNLFHLLSIAKSKSELRSHFMDAAGQLFAATSWGIALFENQTVSEIAVKRLPETYLDDYQEIGWRADPMMRCMIEQHIAVHNQSVLPGALWKRTMVYQQLWLRYGFEHGLIAPLLGGGEVIGKIHFLRKPDMPAFTEADLQSASALSAHFSLALAMLRSPQPQPQSADHARLTIRELQIADLVAKGLNNSEIAQKLGISTNGVKQALKRMFIKLNVTARAEMVAKLAHLSV